MHRLLKQEPKPTDERAVQAVDEAILDVEEGSLRRIYSRTEISRTKVWGTLRNDGFCLYQIMSVQAYEYRKYIGCPGRHGSYSWRLSKE